MKTPDLLNGWRVAIHSTGSSDLDNKHATVVGRVTQFGHWGDIYIIRPDVKVGEYECLGLTNSCLTVLDFNAR